MKIEPGRTLVCSILFLDIAEYSRRDVTEQVRLKQRFNGCSPARSTTSSPRSGS
jgi:hypothetical protein